MSKASVSGLEWAIPESAWEENGGPDHLIAYITVNGCPMFLEAVKATNMRVNDNAPSWIAAAVDGSSDYDTVQTVTIKKRKYILIATPYAN